MEWRDATAEDRGPHLVDKPVRVVWEVPGLEGGAYYEGVVLSYDEESDTFNIKYKDDEQVRLNASFETRILQ